VLNETGGRVPLGPSFMTEILLVVCAWHEARQLPLAAFAFTHSICPTCLERMKSEMKRKSPEWVQLMRDGDWKQIADGSFCGSLVRESGESKLVVRLVGQDSGGPYSLTLNGKHIASGDLDDVLEAGNVY